MRLRVFGLVLLCGGLVACGSSPFATTTETASTTSVAPTPLRQAPCQHPTATTTGNLPLVGGGTEPIVQPKLVCGQAFDAYIDFTSLNGPNYQSTQCYNVPAQIDLAGRPCVLPLRPQPDYQTPSYGAEVWRPLEGRDLVHVVCQVVGNPILSEGTLRDGNNHHSNIWNKVQDARLPGGFGWGSDLWFGNLGWRNVPCPQ